MLAGAKSSVSGQGLGPKGLIGGWGFGKGQPAPLLQLGDLGSAVSSIAGSGAAAKRFSCILEAPDSLSWYLLGAKFGRVGGMAPCPLKSACAMHIVQPTTQQPGN